jgi:hypothetical protein
LSGKKATPGWSTVCCIYVSVCKVYSFACNTINVRRFEIIAPSTRPILPSHIINKENDNIGLFNRSIAPGKDERDNNYL